MWTGLKQIVACPYDFQIALRSRFYNFLLFSQFDMFVILHYYPPLFCVPLQ